MSANISALENTGHATAEWDKVISERQQRRRESIEGEEVRHHVETADDPDGITLTVEGDVIEMEPMGLGKRARISRDAVQADERGDDLGGLDAVVRMIDALIEHSPDEYDQEYWDSLQDEDVKAAFRSLGQQSAGGNEQ